MESNGCWKYSTLAIGQFVISFPDENIIIVRQGEFNNKVEEGNGASDLQHYIAEGYKIASSTN